MTDADAKKLHTMTDAELRSACLLAVALCAQFDLWKEDRPPYWVLLLNEAFARGWLTESADDFVAACLANRQTDCGVSNGIAPGGEMGQREKRRRCP